MLSVMKKELRAFRTGDEGVTLVEYAIALTVVLTVGTATLTGLGNDVTGKMDDVCNELSGANC